LYECIALGKQIAYRLAATRWTSFARAAYRAKAHVLPFLFCAHLAMQASETPKSLEIVELWDSVRRPSDRRSFGGGGREGERSGDVGRRWRMVVEAGLQGERGRALCSLLVARRAPTGDTR
jgi:hypothetical protein